MLAELSILALPLALRGLLRRASRAGSAPPRANAPKVRRGAGDPPPRPERAEDHPNPQWTAGIGADASTHERLAIACIYGYR